MSPSHNTRPRPARCRAYALAAIVGVCVTATGRAETNAAVDSEVELSGLFSPTLGRPVFVEPGRTFRIAAHLPNADATVTFNLIASGQRQPRYRLKAESEASDKLAAGEPLRLNVPPALPARTYDLEIDCNGQRLFGRHCVAVGRVGRSLRLVHLSNMNVGDAGAPSFDQRLIEEVNLVAPTLIVATGDFLDATHADPPVGWRELIDCLTRFDAPIVMACGDHDDIELYSRHVAPSPIGLVNVGRHRALLLFDHPRGPIHRNPEQLRWVERTLGTPGFDGLTLVVTHDDSPNLLRHWQQQGTLTRMIRSGRIGLWFAAGHQDWDGQVYGDVIDAAAPMVYLRTQQSSGAPRGGATGISHYRIVDIVDDRVILPGEAPQSSGTPPSTPVGHLSATVDGPNDGSQTRLRLTAVNNLPYRLDRLAFTVRVRKLGSQEPWCQHARLEQLVDRDEFWECRLRFDLPDKGSLRALVGSGPEPPTPNVSVEFDLDRALHFRRSATPDGLAFLSLMDSPPVVHVRNDGAQPVELSPLVRLDGDPLAYRPLGDESGFATAYNLRLGPDETISLQLDLSAIRVAPGRRELQLYPEGGDLAAPFCRTVDVILGS
ncbi:MAG: hypothetical protein KKI02_08350 [Planctomycetes bacterium]|nr:hypothetical protein [Planctomycetota bacterium]